MKILFALSLFLFVFSSCGSPHIEEGNPCQELNAHPVRGTEASLCTYTLPDGRTIDCLIAGIGYRFGMSCDWPGSK